MKTNPTILKKPHRFFPALLGAATASLLLIGSPAQAGYIVTLEQVGSNVVATGSGAIDLTDLTLVNTLGFNPRLQPLLGIILTGPTNVPSTDLYTNLAGPLNFGSGATTFANSGSGD